MTLKIKVQEWLIRFDGTIDRSEDELVILGNNEKDINYQEAIDTEI